MPAEDERIATEKLLEVIRGKRKSLEDDSSPQGLLASEPEMKSGHAAQSPMSESLRPPTGETPAERPLSLEETPGETKGTIKSIPQVSPWTPRKRPWRIFGIGWEKTILGLDIGFHSIKYVLQKQTTDGPILQDFGMKMLPTLPEDALSKDEDIFVAAIRELIKDCDIRANRVVVAVSGPQVAIRRMAIAKVPSRELRDSIFWAIRKEIPISTDHFFFDYHIMDEAVAHDARKLDALIAAAESPLVDRVSRIMKKSGLRLDGVTTVPMALWNVQHALRVVSGQQPAVFLDIGRRATTFAFFHSGKLAFTREVFAAGQSLAAAFSDQANTEPVLPQEQKIPALAEESKETEVSGAKKEASGFDELSTSRSLDSQSPALARLLNEINRSLDYCQSRYPEAPLEPIYISGGVACTAGFDRLLAEGLGLEVQRLNPFSCLRPGNTFLGPNLSEEVAPLYGIAVGLALDDGRGINLLPEEQRTRTEITLDHCVLPAGVAAAAVAILMAALFGYYTAKSGSALKTFSDIQASYQSLAKLELAATRQLTEQEEQLALNRRVLSYINHRASRAPAVMKEISLITPSEIVLNSVSIDKKKSLSLQGPSPQEGPMLFLEITGAVFGNAGLQGSVLTQFLLALEESPFFKLPRILKQSTEVDGGMPRLNFTMECQMELE